MNAPIDGSIGNQTAGPRRALRASALLHGLTGVGVSAVIPSVLMAMAREGQIQSGPMGIRALGGGPFEQLGIDRMVELGWFYVGLSLLEIIAGILLWRRRRTGAWLSVALLPPTAVFWVGFALPGPPLVTAVRLWLLWVGRTALR